MLKSVAIGYGRRFDAADSILTEQDKDKQELPLITYTENDYTKDDYTNAVMTDDTYRIPLQSESRTYELLNVTPDSDALNVTNLFRFKEMEDKVQEASAHDIPYEDVNATEATEEHPYRRLIEHMRQLYNDNDLSGPLQLGEMSSLGLPYETYKLAFTPQLLIDIYKREETNLLPNPVPVLRGEGGYVLSDDYKAQNWFPNEDPNDHWWIPSGQVFYSPSIEDTPVQELDYARQHFFLPRRFRDPFENTSTVQHDIHDLLITETTDPLGNVMQAQNNYRVLQPQLMTGQNGNRSEVKFDALGMVVGTAVMGKVGENLGDSFGDSLDRFEPDLDNDAIVAHIQNPLANPHDILEEATTRLVYDLHQYQRTRNDPQPQPNVVYTLAREKHDSDLTPGEQTKIQHNFLYSDGFGREIQTKIQAEPGNVDSVPTDHRWVGSGWTIFNNKGKPVKQYEPFFSATHQFEFAKTVGVSPTLFYDPVERVVATLHPNHTYEKVVFDPWQQETWDVNDTVLQADPKNDPDAGDYFSRLPDAEYLPTWHTQRQSGALGADEQEAANKAAAHANTPTRAYLDTLGRTFLTVADNGTEGKYETRVELDIEGNQRSVTDAKDRIVMTYDYDMLGNSIKQVSMEAGTRWMLNDVAGKPIYAWDSRDHTIRTTYDELQRPTETFMREGSGDELMVGRTVYGEAQGNALNHRGKVFQQFDGAGVVTNEEYDFKGNPLRSNRQLAQDYKNILNWSEPVSLEEPPFSSSTTYDALNRPMTLTTPDNSVIYPSYNEANLLERVEANLRGAGALTPFVNNINYDAKGQRERIEYGNSTFTEYTYDKETFRLVNLKTVRPTYPVTERVVQDLRYTYDPAGNITHIQDDADIQNVVFFRNQRVEPSADYTYDAIYRLIEATGREHLGQVGGAMQPPAPTSHTDSPRVGLLHRGDGNAMGIYSETYQYDEVGNILEMIHSGTDPAHPGWTRSYAHNETSQIEPGNQSNRLTSTTIGGTTEAYSTNEDGYDAHGNMLHMPHLSQMTWDFKDQLQMVDLGGGGKAYYVYDAAGQRVRKVIERQNGTRQKECIYLGGLEIYREYNGDGNTVTLERETLHIMDDSQSITTEETETEDTDSVNNSRRIAMVETRTKGTDSSPAKVTRYQFDNHLGSASLELDNTGQVISYEEYYPYGSTSYQAVRSQTETSKRYRYTGKERDEESGLYYHGARYYAPWLGRWISVDPAGLVDGLNRFVYARGSPSVFQDHDGKQARKEAPPDKRKGITFSSESKISAQEMLKKIKASKKLKPWMKNVFAVKGNLLYAKKKFRIPKGATVPKWFQLFVNTALSNTVHVTTGKVEMKKAGALLVGDYEAGDVPGHFVSMGPNGPKKFFSESNIPDKYKDDTITLGEWKTSMIDKFAGWEGKNNLRSVERKLVVIGNRQVFKTKTVAIDDEKILETFFHEVAAHQGVYDDIEFNKPNVSADDRMKQSIHSKMWARLRLFGASPTDSDRIAKQVSDFFGVKLDMTLFEKAKKAYSSD